MKTLRVVRYAFLSGAQDMAAIFTWKTWLLGWYLRVCERLGHPLPTPVPDLSG